MADTMAGAGQWVSSRDDAPVTADVEDVAGAAPPALMSHRDSIGSHSGETSDEEEEEEIELEGDEDDEDDDEGYVSKSSKSQLSIAYERVLVHRRTCEQVARRFTS